MKIVLCSDKNKLMKVIPKKYYDQALSVPEEAAPYSVVVLKDSVAKSRAIEKAIGKCISGSTLVVAVNNLSQEAADALKAAQGIPLTTNDFYWTDQRYQYIKEFGGAKEKPRQQNS